MSRLRVYTVHINPSLQHPYEDAEFVKEGFNFWAFAFTGFWALYNRIWFNSLAIFIINGFIAKAILNGELNHLQGIVAQLAFHLLIGFFANDWLRSKLRKKGFIIADIVTGDSLLKAEQRFFDRYFANQKPAPFVA